jgi:hypothetical protein
MKNIKRNLALTGISLVLGVFADISPSYGVKYSPVISQENTSQRVTAVFGGTFDGFEHACRNVGWKTLGFGAKTVGGMLLGCGLAVMAVGTVMVLPAWGLVTGAKVLIEKSRTLHGAGRTCCECLGKVLGIAGALTGAPGALVEGVGALPTGLGTELLKAGDRILK